MKPFAAYAWDSDAQDAVHRTAVNKAELLNPDYFARTADLIEECRDPDNPRERLTLAALKAWEVRCTTAPALEEPIRHAHRTIRPAATH